MSSENVLLCSLLVTIAFWRWLKGRRRSILRSWQHTAISRPLPSHGPAFRAMDPTCLVEPTLSRLRFIQLARRQQSIFSLVCLAGLMLGTELTMVRVYFIQGYLFRKANPSPALDAAVTTPHPPPEPLHLTLGCCSRGPVYRVCLRLEPDPPPLTCYWHPPLVASEGQLEFFLRSLDLTFIAN